MPETPPSNPIADGPRKRLNYAGAQPSVMRRSMGTARLWARDTFSRDQLVAGLKQLAWVAPLTVLIWVYAEREQQIPRSMPIPIVARSSSPQFHARLADPANGLVQVTLRGPRSRIEQVENQVGLKDPVVADVGHNGRTGIQSIPVATILSQDARFRGLTMTSGTPSVDVDVNPIDEESLTVKLRPEDAGQVQDPVFTPNRVKVRIPRHVARAARDANQGQLVAYAELGKLTPGTSAQSNVRIVIAGADPDEVRVDPPTVSASFNVRAADEVMDIDSVPVIIKAVQTVTNQYDIKFTPATVFNVKVEGPREAIEQLRSRATRVEAGISITGEDVGSENKNIEFVLPPGVRIHPDSQHETSVKLTVTKKGAADE
jgi:hypothetical protein